jgi:hypothetical protein
MGFQELLNYGFFHVDRKVRTGTVLWFANLVTEMLPQFGPYFGVGKVPNSLIWAVADFTTPDFPMNIYVSIFFFFCS